MFDWAGTEHETMSLKTPLDIDSSEKSTVHDKIFNKLVYLRSTRIQILAVDAIAHCRFIKYYIL